MDEVELLDRWRRDLAAWAIPDHITARVSESPWVLPRPVFAHRAARQMADPSGPSYDRAREALDPPGSVLDIGAGAGAACLPLAARATAITAVDTDAQLLEVFTGYAARLDPPVSARTVLGRWPDVRDRVRSADVVTCHHVVYNVADLGPFVAALTDHARRRVVVELTARHPLATLNPLWERFHGLRRPQAPVADDVLAILDALGLDPGHQSWTRPAEVEYDSFGELVEVTCRRLCLPPDRAGEVAAALDDLGIRPDQPPDVGSSGRELVTIWWSGTAR